MKLLRHECILGTIALIFIFLVSLLSFNDKTVTTVAQPSNINAVPYLIDINTADADELDLLDGIGPALAKRIIDYREEHGPFASCRDLCNVSGIGSSTVDNIIDYIEV